MLIVFLVVAGLVLAFVLFSFNRKPQPGRRDAKRPAHAQRNKPAPIAPSAALRVRSGQTTANTPIAASDEVPEFQGDIEIIDDVLELGPDDFELIPFALSVPLAAERKAAAVVQNGLRLEL